MKRPYEVFVEVMEVQRFEVSSANTPREAEQIVEQMVEEMERGDLVEREIMSITAQPIEDIEEETETEEYE